MLKLFLPATILVYIGEILKSGLVAQGIEQPFIFINGASLLVSIICLTICEHMEMKLKTAAINLFVLNGVQCLMYLVALLRYTKMKHQMLPAGPDSGNSSERASA